MTARRRSSKAEKDLTERQRYWLKHLRATERSGEPLTAYAKRLGLSAQSMYEAKSRLRAYGLIAPAIAHKTSKTAPSRFTRVSIEPREAAPPKSLRVRLASGAVLEWSEAPQGDALRELLGLVS
jgi:hypothetical protein